MDDEYFRIVLTLRYDTYENSSARENWPSVLRSFQRPEGVKLKQNILGTLKKVDLYTPGGIYYGESGIYQIDLSRIEAVISRIIRGIYYKEKARRIPDEMILKPLFLDDFEKLNPESKQIVAGVLTLLRTEGKTIIGDDVFEYKMKFLDDESDGFVSILTFFKYVSFLIYGIREDNLQRN